MSKFLAIILFVGSVGLFGYGFHTYANSGQEILKVPVSGRTGVLQTPQLNMHMSPVRVILGVKYEVYLDRSPRNIYRYKVDMLSPLSKSVMSENRMHTDKQSDQGTSIDRSTQNHVIGTMNVEEDGVYRIEWAVLPKKGEVKQVTIALRRNVEPLNIPLMIGAGVLFVLGWIAVFLGRRAGA